MDKLRYDLRHSFSGQQASTLFLSLVKFNTSLSDGICLIIKLPTIVCSVSLVSYIRLTFTSDNIQHRSAGRIIHKRV